MPAALHGMLALTSTSPSIQPSKISRPPSFMTCIFGCVNGSAPLQLTYRLHNGVNWSWWSVQVFSTRGATGLSELALTPPHTQSASAAEPKQLEL